MAQPKTVEFHFDPISPFSWLAARQCGRLDAAGVYVDFRPVLLAGLLTTHGTKGPAEVPAKRTYTMRDVLRIAKRLGLPAAGPPTHPFNPLRALRMCIALDDADQRRSLAISLLAAAWERGLDLTDDAILERVAAEAGLDGAALLERAGEADVKRRLVDATEAAAAAGIFGVPTFRIEGEIFWGEDRIDALLWRLEGNSIDESLLAKILARPQSAVRKAG